MSERIELHVRFGNLRREHANVRDLHLNGRSLVTGDFLFEPLDRPGDFFERIRQLLGVKLDGSIRVDSKWACLQGQFGQQLSVVRMH